MKIGLSYSRCLRDIIDGKVDIADVLVVISRTDFDPRDDKQWKGIWAGYGGGTDNRVWVNPEWYGYGDEYEDRFRSVSIELYESGKFHQPRQFGARPTKHRHYWLETVLPVDELESNPTIKRAWENFQVVAGLANTKLVPSAGDDH